MSREPISHSTASAGQALRRVRHRRDLIREARRLLIKEGPVGVTIDRVAARARVSKPAVYRYFDSKQALLDAVVDAEMNRLILHVRTALESKTLATLAERGAAGLLEHAERHEDAFLATVGQTPLSWKPNSQPVNKRRRAIRRDTAAALRQPGMLPPARRGEADILAHTVISVGIAFAISWLEVPPPERMGRQDATRLLGRMVRAIFCA